MPSNRSIPRLRLLSQHIAGPRLASPKEVVAHMGAVQAQDYAASLWAIALRCGAIRAEVEAAIESAEIVRTWPMRGTLHWLAPEDVRWMVELLAPRAIAKAAARTRQLEIDERVLIKARKLIEARLRDGNRLTRPELYGLMAEGGLTPEGQRGIHILAQLSMSGVLCFGSHRGKQPTFVLLDEWVPPSKPKPRDEALAEAALRYFNSHGPATANDFAWWTGLTLTEARSTLAAVESSLESEAVDGSTYWFAQHPGAPRRSLVYLLPGFDEYILGYTNRAAILTEEHAKKLVPGNNGMFMAAIVAADGRVLGTWRKASAKGRLVLRPHAFGDWSSREQAAFDEAGRSYERFLGD